ncbi:MAG TPA: response regulator transcription factor, partial [Bacteroidetes bacterium]|nr:response regulator transcription factor [Bacteroidota bacterium]
MEQAIKIAIIEDIKDIAYELQELFNEEDDMQCNQIYHNAEDAITFLTKNPPDVVLVDIGLPGINGIEAIIKIRECCPKIEFCMFTVFEDNEKIFKSIQAGAKGYILKNSDPDIIVKSLRELFHGGSPMNPEIARKVIDAFSTQSHIKGNSTDLPLTDREFELLDLLSHGLLYKEIA